MGMEIVMDPVRVMYVEARGGLAGLGRAWHELESRLTTLKGRRFYGTFFPRDGAYRACVAIMDDDEPKLLGFPTWTIPGGKYARAKVDHFSENPDKIGKTFESLAHEHRADLDRWSIEYYKSRDEVVLMLPVL